MALQALDLSGGGGVGSGGLLGSGAGAAVGGATSSGMGGGLGGAGGGLPPLGGGVDDDDAEAEGMESPVQFVCVALLLLLAILLLCTRADNRLCRLAVPPLLPGHASVCSALHCLSCAVMLTIDWVVAMQRRLTATHWRGGSGSYRSLGK